MVIRKLSYKHFYMLAIVLCFIDCLDFRLYSIFNNNLYYLIALLIVIDFLMISRVNIRGLGLLILTIIYFIVDNLCLTGTPVLGCKYAVIFVAIYLFERIRFDKAFLQIGILFALIYTVRFMIASESYIKQFYYQSTVMHGIKDVQVLNINIPCFMVFVCFILIILYCKSYKVKHEKLITFISLLVSILLSLRFGCRTAIVSALIAFSLFEIVPIRIWNNKKLVINVVSALFLIGCIYPLIIVLFFYDGSIMATNLFFSGREKIWGNYFTLVSHDPFKILFGLGDRYRTAVSNGLTLHNSFLEWIFNFGFIGLFLYWFVAIRIIKKAFERKMNEIKLCMVIAYIVMIVFAFANTAIQREYLFLFYSMFLGLINNESLLDEEGLRYEINE